MPNISHTDITATSSYPLLPSQVVSICDLQRLAVYWFNAPGLQLDNEVSQSTDQPHGTVCHQHYGHRTCRRAPSSRQWRRTCPRPSGAIETSSWFWRCICLQISKYVGIVVFNVPLDTLQVISETNINIQTSVLQIRLRIDIWGALQILFVLYCTYIHTYRRTMTSHSYFSYTWPQRPALRRLLLGRISGWIRVLYLNVSSMHPQH